jgi:hypothetical protein
MKLSKEKSLTFILAVLFLLSLTTNVVCAIENGTEEFSKIVSSDVIDDYFKAFLLNHSLDDTITYSVDFRRNESEIDDAIENVTNAVDAQMSNISDSIKDRVKSTMKELQVNKSKKEILEAFKKGDKKVLANLQRLEDKYNLTVEQRRGEIELADKLKTNRTHLIDTYIKSRYEGVLLQQIDELVKKHKVTLISYDTFFNRAEIMSDIRTLLAVAEEDTVRSVFGQTLEPGGEELSNSVPTTHADIYFHDLGTYGVGEDILFLSGYGVQTSHPAFGDVSQFLCRRFGGMSGNGCTDISSNSHDTLVAGVVISNDPIYTGMAYGVDDFYIGKIDNDDYTDWTSAARWAVDGLGGDDADIIMMSTYQFGDPPCNTQSELDVDYWVRFYDICWVKSAGNTGPGWGTITAPGKAHNIITVGAANVSGDSDRSNDVLLEDSSRGPECGGLIKPELTAPGAEIMSTDRTGGFSTTHGTSFAQPHVSGAILLLNDLDGTYSCLITKSLLLNSAEDKGSPGPDNQWGYGYLDLERAYLERGFVEKDRLHAEGETKLIKLNDVESGDKATMVWYRRFESDNSTPVVNNFDLYAYDETDSYEIDDSRGLENVIEQVQFDDDYSSVILKIELRDLNRGSSEEYSLATSVEQEDVVTPTLSSLLSGASSVSGCENPFNITLRVTNDGDVTAHSVSADLQLPSGVTLITGSDPYSYGTIAASSYEDYTWTVKATTSGSKTFDAPVTSTSYDEAFNSDPSDKIVTINTATENCGNGIDDDCDGFIDGADGDCGATASESAGRTAIEQGIANALTGVTILTDQQIYIRYANTTQRLGTFDKFAISGGQRWAFNYVTGADTFTNMASTFNNTVNILEIANTTTTNITSQVESFIDSTKW